MQLTKHISFAHTFVSTRSLLTCKPVTLHLGTETSTAFTLKYETLIHITAAVNETENNKRLSGDTIITRLTKGLSCLGTS